MEASKIEQLRADSWNCKEETPDDARRISVFLAEIHALCAHHGLTFDTEGCCALVVCDFDFTRADDSDLLTAVYR